MKHVITLVAICLLGIATVSGCSEAKAVPTENATESSDSSVGLEEAPGGDESEDMSTPPPLD